MSVTTTIQELNPVDFWLSYSDSEESKNQRKAILNRFCLFTGRSPEQWLELAGTVRPGQPQRQIEDAILQYFDHRKSDKLAHSTACKEISAVRAFFSINSVKLAKTPKKFRATESDYESKLGHIVLTQEQVTKMINYPFTYHKPLSLLENRTVMTVLAQTGQRIGILTGLRFEMIAPLADGWRIVHVPGDIKNRKAVKVNKTKNSYKFLLHPQSCSLIDKLQQYRTDPFVFTIAKRRMQDVIAEAAEKSGVQETIPTELQEEWHSVHAHPFRRYFKNRMRQAGTKDDVLLNYLIGHTNKYRYTYDAYPDSELLEEYKKAEPFLNILSPIVIEPITFDLCPHCSSRETIRWGNRYTKNGEVQNCRCKSCGKYFTLPLRGSVEQ